MIGYVTLGASDLARGGAFYDEIFSLIGAARFMESERFIAWSSGEGKAGFGLTTPYNGEAASVGNGVMVALAADSVEQVHAVYDRALALGGTDEGAPGPREMEGFYAGYFRDLDGNKLNVFCFVGG